MDVGRSRVLLGAVIVLAAACGGSDDDDRAATADSTDDSVDDSVVSTSTTTPPTTTVPEPVCVVTVSAGDSLSAIVASIDGLTIEALRDENRLGESDVIHPDDELDVCIGNDVDDVTGASKVAPDADAVREQQRELNELFEQYSIGELLVDGESGPLTRQQLCAARLGLGLSVDTVDMSEGSPEEQAIFEAEELRVPDGAADWTDRWVLIDQTCQVMFLGEFDELVDIYPTSTGQPGFDTWDVLANRAFRFDPAIDNGGWHDSTNFPVEIDNPQNGNMYKPIYFNGGQAIHGADVVPPDPRSKGCARLLPWHQDALIEWIGIDDLTEATWNEGDIGLTVTVQGRYRPAA